MWCQLQRRIRSRLAARGGNNSDLPGPSLLLQLLQRDPKALQLSWVFLGVSSRCVDELLSSVIGPPAGSTVDRNSPCRPTSHRKLSLCSVLFSLEKFSWWSWRSSNTVRFCHTAEQLQNLVPPEDYLTLWNETEGFFFFFFSNFAQFLCLSCFAPQQLACTVVSRWSQASCCSPHSARTLWVAQIHSCCSLSEGSQWEAL